MCEGGWRYSESSHEGQHVEERTKEREGRVELTEVSRSVLRSFRRMVISRPEKVVALMGGL